MNAAIPSFPALAECTIANLSDRLALASLGEIEAYDNESSLLSIVSRDHQVLNLSDTGNRTTGDLFV